MEWGGVGLLAFLPSKKTGGHALKAAFVTEGFPIHPLTMENSSSIASRAWAVSMFKLRAKNNVHHQKESELAKEKKKRPFQFFPIYACQLFPPYKLPEKMNTPIR